MIFQAISAFYLLSFSGLIILLYFLRTKSKKYFVSALFLWEGLKSQPQSRAARIREKLEPLLLLQLLILTLFTLALADPAVSGLKPHYSGLAIIIDGSASMHALATSGSTRYDMARKEALSIIDDYPSSIIAAFQLSSSPRVLSSFGADSNQARQALMNSEPTWYSDGSSESLLGLLESQGGSGSFDRMVLLTDHSFDMAISGLDQRIISGGDNLAITAFSVRQAPDRQVVTSYLRVQNNSHDFKKTILEVTDGVYQNQLPIGISPGEEKDYILSLPSSTSVSFKAALQVEDSLPFDDTRYFNLSRSIQRRVRWAGPPNRYLKKALEALWPITLISEDDYDPVDLTIAYNTVLPSHTEGNILLVHAGLEGLIKLGEEKAPVKLKIKDSEDPFLKDIDPFDFRVFSTPQVNLPSRGETPLALGDEPFIYRLQEDNRQIALIAPDPLKTNLPVTIDFPLLIRNILVWFTPLPAKSNYQWRLIGESIRLDRYGQPLSIKKPQGEKITLSTDQKSFIPHTPGIYILESSKGTYPLVINVDPSESNPADFKSSQNFVEVASKKAQILFPLWPYLVGMGLLLMLAELYFYHGERLRWFG